ncbi:TetR/AcrR family transcriptional regulator [Algibacter agarivorans]|uniref:TetR/AcrR family transcriptional regulator n=1 Tax=Algibacter agarivorans TaxID=1109741 RepID=A0ABP9GKZ2_9FLAO
MRPQKVLDNDMYSALTKVFREKGYEGASLNEISDATGLKKASLYHRFPEGKKQMAEAVFNYIDKWVEIKIFGALINNTLTPDQRLNESINNIKELYNGGEDSCIFRTLSMKVGLELFGSRIKNGMEQWIHHFKELGLAFGQSKEVAKSNAVQNLIDIQGSLIVSEGLKDLTIFENTLKTIKNRYNKE